MGWEYGRPVAVRTVVVMPVAVRPAVIHGRMGRRVWANAADMRFEN
jgi:hypothetical protein